MKRTLALLATMFATLTAFAGDELFYGAWWTTATTPGAVKRAGELVIWFNDYGNAAGIGTVTIKAKEGQEDGGTVTEHTFTGGMWERKGTSTVVTFSRPGVLPTDTQWRGKVVINTRNMTGTWKKPGVMSGKFQATNQ